MSIVNNKKIRFAVIGMGFVGKRHASIIQRHPEAELVAICDNKVDAERLKELGFDAPFYTDIKDLLAAEIEIDVVNICTPNGLHAEHSLLALKAKKHIVCEKPMALYRKDGEAMLHESLLANRQVFCVMQNRYSPPSLWLKQVISEGRLGDIYMVQVNCFWNRDDRYYRPNGQAHSWKGKLDSDGGTLFTQFSHFIDMMYWVFGDIENIQAKFANFNHQDTIEFEDSGLVQFDFVHGGMGTIQYSTAVYQSNLESSMTVIGSKGSLKIGGQYMNEVTYCNIENYSMPELPPTNPANDYGVYKGSAANHVYVINNVVDVLMGRKQITTNALEGLKVVEIIEKIYQLKK